jgi:hypothetical protein
MSLPLNSGLKPVSGIVVVGAGALCAITTDAGAMAPTPTIIVPAMSNLRDVLFSSSMTEHSIIKDKHAVVFAQSLFRTSIGPEVEAFGGLLRQ